MTIVASIIMPMPLKRWARATNKLVNEYENTATRSEAARIPARNGSLGRGPILGKIQYLILNFFASQA